MRVERGGVGIGVGIVTIKKLSGCTIFKECEKYAQFKVLKSWQNYGQIVNLARS
jgi:hypothetical protein